MNILLVLIPVTLLVVAIAVALFFWAVSHQQFDDLDNPGILPLLEDDPGQGVAGDAAPFSSPDAAPPPDGGAGSSDVPPPAHE
ncbi:MAG: cbb3-type cytochrome oxidase assembly protein CcoS [Pseudomonadota bacterium]